MLFVSNFQIGVDGAFGAETQFGVDVILALPACLEWNFTLKSMESSCLEQNFSLESMFNLESMFKLGVDG